MFCFQTTRIDFRFFPKFCKKFLTRFQILLIYLLYIAYVFSIAKLKKLFHRRNLQHTISYSSKPSDHHCLKQSLLRAIRSCYFIYCRTCTFSISFGNVKTLAMSIFTSRNMVTICQIKQIFTQKFKDRLVPMTEDTFWNLLTMAFNFEFAVILTYKRIKPVVLRIV